VLAQTNLSTGSGKIPSLLAPFLFAPAEQLTFDSLIRPTYRSTSLRLSKRITALSKSPHIWCKPVWHIHRVTLGCASSWNATRPSRQSWPDNRTNSSKKLMLGMPSIKKLNSIRNGRFANLDGGTVSKTMKVDLEGKVALVTGAACGIGRATADALATNGARVIYADIDIATAQQVAKKVEGALALPVDVSDEKQVDKLIDEVLARFGTLDIVVNNAGINTIQHRVNIDNFPSEEWDRILKVDLTGVFFVSRAAAKPLLAKKSGRIINISSVLGLVPARLQSPFVAAKAGVINLTRAMALELGSHGVLVNCIAPGSIFTDSTQKLFYAPEGKFNGSVKALLSHIPLGRPGTVEEVAHAVVFLAAPESSYINGAILTVDGGWIAGYSRDF
jgi:3-oxoacyl-[acyl-carrier protein] reductase